MRNKLKEFGFDLVLLVGCTKVFVGNTQCAVQGGEVVHTLDVTSSREVIEAAYMQATFKGE
ncbi:hypothetical protein FDH29_gp10 [Aquamicrobium phage P14]|uniref:Uncharacterized protein n=1 Tax=Aquamicrobium phage P14 TaxID=1927013 RepID=A0A1L5C047_9CAUD|nr:hypothetical protein FDH29_gp10 [Aquamicrobium phage P14]APL99468.1 hypothetical protein BB738_0100 [Aquamicrobium phage P14]